MNHIIPRPGGRLFPGRWIQTPTRARRGLHRSPVREGAIWDEDLGSAESSRVDSAMPHETYIEHLATLAIELDDLELDTDGAVVPAQQSLGSLASISDLPPLHLGGPDGQVPELELLEILGTGGAGEVRNALQLPLDRHVAVKVLRPGADPRTGDGLLREALVTARLEHPNIVPVHALGRHPDGSPALVMKRIEGELWTEFIGRSLVEDLRLLMTVCNATHFAHSKGVLHRDLKPDNVMVGGFGELYLLDWGLAVRLPGSDLPLTDAASVRSIAGTPGYMAPEMASPTGGILGVHSDVYLLGAILHQILTGRRRHRGANVQEVLTAAFASEPPSFPADVPEELAELCRAATHVDPAERPESALAFRQALSSYLDHRASRELCRQAVERIDELELALSENADSAHALVIEARFGLSQALRNWPENHAAEQALDRLRHGLFAREIRLENHAAAAAVLAEFSEPPALLRDELSGLANRLANREQELAALREAGDLSLGALTRSRVMAGMAATSFMAGLAIFFFDPEGLSQSYAAMVPAFGTLFASAGLGVLLTRNARHSSASKKLLEALFLCIFCTLIYWGFAWLIALNFGNAMALSYVFAAGCCAMLGHTLDRHMYGAAIIFVIVAASIAALPIYCMSLSFGGLGLGVAYLAVAWRRT